MLKLAILFPALVFLLSGCSATSPTTSGGQRPNHPEIARPASSWSDLRAQLIGPASREKANFEGGVAAFLMGDTATARSHLAAALAPGSVWTDTVQPRKTLLAGRLALAWCYLAVDSVPAALEQCHLVLGETERGGNAYRPLLGRAYIAEGVCQSRQGDYQSATEAFGRARKVGMQDSPTEILWGRTILSTLKLHDSMEVRRRVVNDALRHFRLAVALDPSSITAHLTLARTLGLLPLDNTVPGWPKEEACAEFRKVLNLDHGNQEAIEGLIRARCW